MANNAPYEVWDLTRTNRVPLLSSAPANTASQTSTYSKLDRREGGSDEIVPTGERFSTCVTGISRPLLLTSNDDDNKKAEEIKSATKYFGGIQITLLTVIMVLFISCFIGVFHQGAETRAMVAEIKSTLKQINSSLIEERFQLANTISQLNKSFVSDLLTTQSSCAALPPSSLSGYYWVRNSTVRVYCDMTRTCGNVTGGWMRVGYLNMTQNSQQCPSGLKERVESGIRTCVRDSSSEGCTSVFNVTANVKYSRVCGRVIGYQIGSTDAFATIESTNEIDSPYVDGVSLTRGNNPRQHIWTFAAGLNKRTNPAKHHNSYCPCQTNPPATPPDFVGKDYFCDSGNGDSSPEFFTDPLWDGTDCTCCNDPPRFYKQLPQPTTDDIEMRLCRDQARNDDDVAVQVIEIYVQ